jgi:hypothetical protein
VSGPPVVSRRQSRRGWTKKVTVETRKPVNVDRIKSLTTYTVTLGKLVFTGTARAILNRFKLSAKQYDTLCYRLQHGERDVAKLKAGPKQAARPVRVFKGEVSDYRGEGYAEHTAIRGCEAGVDPEQDEGDDAGAT